MKLSICLISISGNDSGEGDDDNDENNFEYYVLGTVPKVLHILTHSVLIAILGDGC